MGYYGLFQCWQRSSVKSSSHDILDKWDLISHLEQLEKLEKNLSLLESIS